MKLDDELVTITGPPSCPAGSQCPGPRVQPVRVCRPHDRAVVAVPDGEGVGQASTRTPDPSGCSSPSSTRRSEDPPIAASCGWRRTGPSSRRSNMRAGPTIRGTGRACIRHRWWRCRDGKATAGGAAPPGHACAKRPWRSRRGVVETSHTFVRAEVVIERPVLVHEEDHVLDRTEVRARRRHTGRLAGRLASTRGQGQAERPRHARDQHFSPSPQVRSRDSRWLDLHVVPPFVFRTGLMRHQQRRHPGTIPRIRPRSSSVTTIVRATTAGDANRGDATSRLRCRDVGGSEHRSRLPGPLLNRSL